MAGAKEAEKKVEQEVPPNAAGREVLSYVQQQEKEADEAFAAAQGIEPGEEEKEEEKPAAAKEPEVKEPEAKEPEKEVKVADGDDDLTKGLNTENATKRISAAQTKMHSSNTRAKTAEDEVQRLKTENETLQAQMKTAAAAPAAKDTPEETKAPKDVRPDDDELQKSLSELEQEYPEIAKPMLKMMARQDVENKRLTEKIDGLEAKDVERTNEAKVQADSAHLTAIRKAHTDLDEILGEPLYDEWIEGLPAIEKAGAQAINKDGSTEDVIELLTAFKKANGYELPPGETDVVPVDKGKSKLAKAKEAANPSFKKSNTPNLKDGEPLFTRKQIDAMTQKEYDAQEEAIDDAMSKGLIF